MPELTDIPQELLPQIEDALSRAFDTFVEARRILDRVQFPEDRVPAWDTSRNFWGEIVRQVQRGVLPKGNLTGLVRQGLKELPNNPALNRAMEQLQSLGGKPSRSQVDGHQAQDNSPLAFSAEEEGLIGAAISNHRTVASIYADLTIVGFAPAATRRLTAAALDFMDITLQVHADISHAFESQKAKSVGVDTFAELFKIIGARPRVALTGEPGSGKSTTLKKLAYEFANRALKNRAGLIPIFIDLAAATDPLQACIDDACLALSPNVPRSERTVFLFDGLNETSRSTVDQLAKWITADTRQPVVVACRRLDYIERQLPLRQIEIHPLTVSQIFDFIARFFEDPRDREQLFWSLTGEKERAAWNWFRKNKQDFATFETFWQGNIGPVHPWEIEKSLILKLQQDAKFGRPPPGMLELVTNPFLLYIAILIYVNNDAPPENRCQFFEQFVSLMMKRLMKLLVFDPSKNNATEDRMQAVAKALEELAFLMLEDGCVTRVSESWFQQKIAALDLGLEPLQLISALRSSGLIDNGDPEAVRFRHQLLQEFFAARKLDRVIADGVPAARFWPSNSWWERTQWDEVALLLAGLDRSATRVVQWLKPTNPTLAYRCATEVGVSCDSELLQELLDPPAETRHCPFARAEWGRRVAASGDNRRGVGCREDGLPEILWCAVPGGRFKIGGDLAHKAPGLAVQGVDVEITYDYYLAKFPVTVAQFEAFVRAGYRNDAFWTASGLRWRGKQTAPRLWNDERFHLRNHPIVGVTWYEAIAFCNWLSSELDRSGPMPGQSGQPMSISLPTQSEWERAARFPDERSYPWGNVYLPGCANIDEIYERDIAGPFSLRRTSAVGLYPRGASQLGILDMCGNVWEWCLSKWDVNYSFPEDVDLEGTEHRGVRGGSWYNSIAFACASANDCHDPDLGVFDVGFRLVCRPASSLQLAANPKSE